MSKANEFCCSVACRLTGVPEDEIEAAVKAVDGPDVASYTQEDLSGSFDIIFQFLLAILPMIQDCDRSKVAKRAKRRSRRVRNRIDSEARSFCQCCSGQRFGRWAHEPELLANAVLEETASMEEADIVAVLQDVESEGGYDLI